MAQQPFSGTNPWADDPWPDGFSNLFRSLFADMDRLLASALGVTGALPPALTGPGGNSGSALPVGDPGTTIQVEDAGTELVIRATVSGLDPTRLDVRLGPQWFFLQGEIQHTFRQEHSDSLTQAAAWSSITRSLPLPAPVDPSRAVVAIKAGVLEVRVPKLQPLTP